MSGGATEPERDDRRWWLIAGVAVVLIVIAIVVILVVRSPGGSATAPPSVDPSDSAAPPTPSARATPSPTPTPTPTPDPEEAAIAGVKAGYAAYVEQFQRAVASPSDEFPPELAKTMSGLELRRMEDEIRSIKQQGIRAIAGKRVVETVRVRDVDLDRSPAVASLTACVDQSSVKLTRSGKSLPSPKYLRETANLKLTDNVWRVDTKEGTKTSDDPC